MQVNPEHASKARAILEQKIEKGRASAMAVFERINTEVPRDSIIKGRALRFEVAPDNTLRVGVNTPNRIGQHALGQFASRAGIPSAYLAELAHGQEPWQRELAADVLQRHYSHDSEKARYLARVVQGEVRGFLSDKFRRLDCRPLAASFCDEVAKIGAVPVDGIASDCRVSLKAILPQIYEPVPGEVLAFGMEWSNSDFGKGLHAIRAFILRVWCLNGATMENALAQMHLGRRLSEDLELSQRTYELDTRASASALRDVVQGTLAPAKIEALCAGIQRAHENKVEWKNVQGSLAKRLLKGELEAAKNAFESQDVYNLPETKSMWRVSNAISWIAGQDSIDADRKMELQRIAGEVINGRKDREVEMAA